MRLSNLMENFNKFAIKVKDIPELDKMSKFVLHNQRVNIYYLINSVLNNFDKLETIFDYDSIIFNKISDLIKSNRQLFVEQLEEAFDKQISDIKMIYFSVADIKILYQPIKNKHNQINDNVFLLQGLVICTNRKYSEYFCSIKHGTPSNIRDVLKTARTTDWDISNLVKIIGIPISYKEFRGSHPDTTWGYVGSNINLLGVKSSIINLLTHNNIG